MYDYVEKLNLIKKKKNREIIPVIVDEQLKLHYYLVYHLQIKFSVLIHRHFCKYNVLKK